MLYKNGYSVIEVLLAGVILSLAISGIVGALILAQRNNQSNIAQSQALEMAKEGIEALKSIRDRNYNDLSNTNNAALSFINNQWGIIASPSSTDDTLDKPFRSRRIKIENGDFVNSKKVTVTVTYKINPEGDTSTVDLSENLIDINKKTQSGVTSESANYRLLDDNFGNMNNNFESTSTP